MTELRQRRELNKILFPEFPNTWRTRSSAFAVVLPILLMSIMVMWEGVLLSAWVEGRDLYELIPRLAAGTVAIPLLLWGAAELSARVEIWTTRKLKLERGASNRPRQTDIR